MSTPYRTPYANEREACREHDLKVQLVREEEIRQREEEIHHHECQRLLRLACEEEARQQHSKQVAREEKRDGIQAQTDISVQGP
mmetsp:Transcript_2059/g.3917  ORF Transcript_2059/g.3917 Transcript_2059/m.3917 type:complete len:84 (+) Transcript_2059:230-481(+)